MDSYAQNPLEVLIEGEDVADDLGRVFVACAVNGVPFDEDQQLIAVNGGDPRVSPMQAEVITSLYHQFN